MRDFNPANVRSGSVKGGPSMVSAGCPNHASQADLLPALSLVSDVPQAVVSTCSKPTKPIPRVGCRIAIH